MSALVLLNDPLIEDIDIEWVERDDIEDAERERERGNVVFRTNPTGASWAKEARAERKLELSAGSVLDSAPSSDATCGKRLVDEKDKGGKLGESGAAAEARALPLPDERAVTLN